MNHKELNVWKKSMNLVVLIYKLSATFPETEKYGLASQMRKSAISIPSNVAEGAGRKSDKELLQFVSISLGSLAELETQYLIAIRLKYVEMNEEINHLLNEVKRLLLGFRNYLRGKN